MGVDKAVYKASKANNRKANSVSLVFVGLPQLFARELMLEIVKWRRIKLYTKRKK